MTDAPNETNNPNIIRQLRSRFRLKLTAIAGALITLASASVLVWLLGLAPFSPPPERSTVGVVVDASCPGPIGASIAIDAFEGRIWLVLELPGLPTRVDKKAQNAKKRAFFARCAVAVRVINLPEKAVIPGVISGDSWPAGTLPPADQTLKIKPGFGLAPGEFPNFVGEIVITPTQLFARDSFGRFHMGVHVRVANHAGMVELNTSLTLPEKHMQADIIRPQPVSIGNTPVETYRFFATAAPDTERGWIDQTYFIAFVDPDKVQIREILLILASTLFGAGIAALLEAFLAGGTAALVRGSGKG